MFPGQHIFDFGSVLTRIQTLKQPDHDILAPLSDRLKVLIKGLLASNPESFVLPRLWTKYRDTIQASLESDDGRFTTIFTAIDRRNSRLNSPGTERELSPRRRLIQLLDTTMSQPLTNELPSQCWHIDGDKSMLILALLDWSTSAHRPGVAKVYVAARILRSWSRYGADISGAILSFLDNEACETGRSKSAFYHLISELARSEHFSTPMYLQWLIARGGLNDAGDIVQDGPCATRLLTELPTHNLSESLIGLRRTLLNRADFSVDDEEEQTTACILLMNRSLPGMQANVDLELEAYDIPASEDLASLTSGLSRTSKSEIGLWLRQKVRLQMLQPTIPPLDDWDDSPMKGGTSAIIPSDFNTVRKYLELIDDYSMLADVLKMVSSSNDAEVLASCADTLNLHLETFAAIAALKGLFEILMTRLRSLNEDIDPIPRVFLASLTDLAARIPEQKIVALQLAQELVRSDRKTATDACSPVSDHMAGVVQNAEADFTDEIEKVLASGNSMDQATLERLFQRIVLRLETSWEKSPDQQRSCGLLLTRLRTFDAQQFDVLMSGWVNRFFRIKSRPSMMQVIGPLISFGCLALYDVIVNWESIVEMEASSNDPTALDISLEALALILTPADLPEAMTIEESYRLRIKQGHMQKDHPLETLSVIRRALEEYLPSIRNESQHTTIATRSLFSTQNMRELLQKLVLIDPDSITRTLIRPLRQSPNARGAEAITVIINRLLTAESYDRSGQAISIGAVLNLANDLTFPFCQMKLAAIFSSQDGGVQDTENGISDALESLDSAIESAVTAGKTAWACIIPLLDISVAQHLRQRAESQFLSLFPFTKLTNNDEMLNLESLAKRAGNLLNIIDATAYSISATASTNSHYARSLAPEINKTFNGIWHFLSTTQTTQIKDAIIGKWLPLLLSFAAIHTSAFDTSKAGHESRAKALLALAATLLELQALDMSTASVNDLTEQTFDLALHLVDSLPDDMRQNCIRSLRDVISNPRLSYLFSFGTNPSEWLVLSQKEKGPSSQTVGANGSGEGRVAEKEKLTPFPLRRWEMLGEPTPNIGENDTSLSLTLFGARRN
jgi:mediator of RNA polymerase II transcription subunit 12